MNLPRLPAVAIVMSLALVGCTTTPSIKFLCPPLAPPTDQAVTALETAGKADPSTAAWVVELDRHYQKCDTLNSK